MNMEKFKSIGFMLALLVVHGSLLSCTKKQEQSSLKLDFGLSPEPNTPSSQSSWVVRIESIHKNEESFNMLECTGSLISPNLILTAQHCFKKEELISSKAFFGLGTTNEKSYQIKISDIDLFPGYETFGENAIFFGKNDLALITLDTPVDNIFQQNIPNVILQLNDFKSKISYGRTRIMFFGYGITESDKSPLSLLYGEAIARTLYNCNKSIFKSYKSADSGSFFWIGSAQSASVRPGDSGGPVTVFKDGKHYLVGVIVTGLVAKNGVHRINAANKLTNKSFVEFFNRVKQKADEKLLNPLERPYPTPQ